MIALSNLLLVYLDNELNVDLLLSLLLILVTKNLIYFRKVFPNVEECTNLPSYLLVSSRLCFLVNNQH